MNPIAYHIFADKDSRDKPIKVSSNHVSQLNCMISSSSANNVYPAAEMLPGANGNIQFKVKKFKIISGEGSKPKMNFENKTDKLTFENAFVKKQLPTKVINTHIPYLKLNTNTQNAHSQIFLEGIQGHPQINININNLNINNFNFSPSASISSSTNSIKKRQSSQIDQPHFPLLNSSNPVTTTTGNNLCTSVNNNMMNQQTQSNCMNLKKFDIENYKPRPNALTPKKIPIIRQELNVNVNAPQFAREDLKTRGSNIITRPSDDLVYQKQSDGMTVDENQKAREEEIETIIEGNNDSFIIELADLLNNVDDKPTEGKGKPSTVENVDNDAKNKFPESLNEEVPDPRINFKQLQILNSQRPQTSYGGLSARQKSLQNSLRQKSSKGSDRYEVIAKNIGVI